MRGNRLILALDVYEQDRALRIATATAPYLWAIKVNWPLILGSGLGVITKLKKVTDLPVIADLKLADIPNTNRLVSRKVFEAGADYVIAHGFAGRDSVEAVMEEGEVILVVDMSHGGAKEFITPATDGLVEMANELKPFGVVAPATRPERIAYVRERLLNGIKILSPGVGAQGGRIRDAIKAGADFLIVGRSIYSSQNPEESARALWEEVRRWS
ncbi:MAG: orotidine-5'-phosphate decarboxylase [Thermococci archaeon]|nr:orotidine-5'-phosphate decarboxylase [Thermococci archaeon]